MKEQDMIKRRNPTGLDSAPDIRTMENAFIVALMRSEKKSGQNLKDFMKKYQYVASYDDPPKEDLFRKLWKMA